MSLATTVTKSGTAHLSCKQWETWMFLWWKCPMCHSYIICLSCEMYITSICFFSCRWILTPLLKEERIKIILFVDGGRSSLQISPLSTQIIPIENQGQTENWQSIKATRNVADLPRTGCPTTPVDEASTTAVLVMSPTKGIQRLSQEHGPIRNSIHRVLKSNENHPSKLQWQQHLSEHDPNERCLYMDV